jgi:hypothetical protein
LPAQPGRLLVTLLALQAPDATSRQHTSLGVVKSCLISAMWHCHRGTRAGYSTSMATRQRPLAMSR